MLGMALLARLQQQFKLHVGTIPIALQNGLAQAIGSLLRFLEPNAEPFIIALGKVSSGLVESLAHHEGLQCGNKTGMVLGGRPLRFLAELEIAMGMADPCRHCLWPYRNGHCIAGDAGHRMN